MTGLLIYNEIKRNRWSINAELFKLKITTLQTNDKLSINSDSKKKPVEIYNDNDNKKKPDKKEQEPSITYTRDDNRNKSKKEFTNTWISKGRIFWKRYIKTSIKNEKQ